MANLQHRLPHNVTGDFFVDSTCINCDTCRQLAPGVFADDGEYSYVFHQPGTAPEERQAFQALLACPTASIGSIGKTRAGNVVQDFPLLVEDPVYYNGFTAKSSFGAQSYFIHHPEGNWMIDSPRFIPALVKRLEAMGGIRYLFLTHRDDVADAKKFAAHFGSERLIHENDKAGQPDAETIFSGDDPISISKNFLILPTPGHTAGHSVLLFQEKYLFSGDHLWWSRRTQGIGASKEVCWYSWPKQIRSMEKLLSYSFEWVLPGHGRRIKYPREEMRKELRKLIQKMKEM